jgi:hypothetical protein
MMFMKRLTRTLPLFLAAALQLLPLLRNIVTSPAAGSSFAIILRWGIGSAAALGAYNAYSAASNYFTSPSVFTGSVGVPFTNNLVLLSTGHDGQVVATITSNTVSVTLTASGQTTNFAMPSGLNFRLIDNPNLANSVYDSIFGTPTRVGTNTFTISMNYAAQSIVTTNITIRILASSSLSPIITNQPVSVTTNVGNNVTFSVTNGGTAPLSYQWYFNTNTALASQTNASATLASVQLTNAGTYSVVITNSTGSVTSSFALLTVWQPPLITNQPASVTNVAGGNATFTVAAGGVPALAYQWQFNGNTPLPGSTNTVLPLTGLRASQAGAYSVVITNSAGSVTSSAASLLITNPLPPIINPPAQSGGLFQFTFIPVVGLTNSVLTNNDVSSGTWAVLTNVAPPATASPVTVTDALGASNRFYRVQIVP